ncbi:tetratricopeptide repeat protein, partial [Candidatus Termititenax aidoneus]
KMQTTDSVWADLGLVRPPNGGILLEYQGEYYTNEFDPSVDLSLRQTRTSRPNDGFSTYLKQVNKDAVIKELHILPENVEQAFRPLRERQIVWFTNIMLASEMKTRGDNRQAREYILRAGEIYPSISTASTLIDLAIKETNYVEIIHYASEILERFGCTTGEDASHAYRSRAISYKELQDYAKAEKDFLAFLKLAQDSGDEEAIRDAYDCLVYLACDNLNDSEKVAQYTLARLNLGVDDPVYEIELRRNLGLAYFKKKDYAAAIDSLLIARKTAKQLDTQQLAVIDDALMYPAINGSIYIDDLLKIAAENLDSTNSFPFHWYIGQFNFEQQNYAEARKYFSLILNQLMSTKQLANIPVVYSWLTRIAARQQDYREVLAKAQDGLKFNNVYSFLHLQSALAYLVLGKTKAAEKAFATAQNLFQQNGDFGKDAAGDLQAIKEFLLKQGRQDTAAQVDDWLAQLSQTKR